MSAALDREQLIRFFTYGRCHYGLPAAEAMTYARDRQYLWNDGPDWGLGVDDEGELSVAILDDDEQPLAVMGGIDLPFTVSDHGNILTDHLHPHLVAIAAELGREHDQEAIAA